MVGRDSEDQKASDAGFVSVARLGGPHGVRGDLRLMAFTEDDAAVFAFDELFWGKNYDPVTISRKSQTKDGFVVAIAGIGSREEAEKVKNRRLYVRRDALDAITNADDYYLTDLIGLSVRDRAGMALGYVRSVENYGAEDLLELALNAPIKGFGKIILLPFRRALVPDVDIDAGFVTVDITAWAAVHTGQDVQERDRQDSQADAEKSCDGNG